MSDGRRLSVARVAQRLDVSTDTVLRLINAGELRAANVGTGRKARWSVAERDLEAFLERRTNAPAPRAPSGG